MADNKQGRDKQAQDAERRQRERDLNTELERGDEPEPPDEPPAEDLAPAVDTLSFPTTGADIVATLGDEEVDTSDGSYTLAQLVPETDEETFDSPAAVRAQLRRPTVATAMARVIEASKTLPNTTVPWSQRKAYESTFEALADIDADDDDEGIQHISDWIVERIHDKDKLPGSRDVRRQAAKFCRGNGYQVRNDEWLGI